MARKRRPTSLKPPYLRRIRLLEGLPAEALDRHPLNLTLFRGGFEWELGSPITILEQAFAPVNAPERLGARAGSARGAREMARKVYRTHIGFQDWVVATTSKKAALAAWNVSRDLFRAGEAEETTDPAAVKAAMSDIGKPVALKRLKTPAKKKPGKKKA